MENVYNVAEVIIMLEELEILLIETTKTDDIYQSLLQACADAEGVYNTLIEELPPSQQAIIEAYLSACEELEHRRTMLALSLKV